MATVVVISDDDILRRSLRRFAGARGHDVVEHEAPGLRPPGFFGGSSDVAFVDLSGAGSDWRAVMVTVTLRVPPVRITVIDEADGPEGLDRLAQAMAFGAEEFMRKPVTRLEIAGVLDRLGL
ncbi:MAG TPA: hypothetical protein VGA37_07245 [Gemmatimonadales bacterium]